MLFDFGCWGRKKSCFGLLFFELIEVGTENSNSTGCAAGNYTHRSSVSCYTIIQFLAGGGVESGLGDVILGVH